MFTKVSFAISRGKLWYNMDLHVIHEIWFPSIYITNALNLEKLGSFGGDDMISLWYKHPSTFQYSEVIKVIIHCEMEFQNFPFDHHDNCALKMRNWLGIVKYVQLNKPIIWYDDPNNPSTNISVQSKKLNFDVELSSNESSTTIENGHGYSEAAIQIKLKRNKVGFDKIILGYYVTTGTFSAMSLLAFFIDPAMVCVFL